MYKGERFSRRGILDFKLFIKPTNPQIYLHFTSCHPRHLFRNLVLGELKRTLRASSDSAAFSSAAQHLFQCLSARGYPKSLLLDVSHHISFGLRPSLLGPPSGRLPLKLPVGTTIFKTGFDPRHPTWQIRQHLQDDQLPLDLLVARAGAPTISKQLVRAATPSVLPGTSSPSASLASPPPPAFTANTTLPSNTFTATSFRPQLPEHLKKHHLDFSSGPEEDAPPVGHQEEPDSSFLEASSPFSPSSSPTIIPPHEEMDQ